MGRSKGSKNKKTLEKEILKEAKDIANKISDISKKSKEFDLNDHIYGLLVNEPFFAAISRNINKIANNSIPTCGVTVDDEGDFVLYYSPFFMTQLTDTQKRAVIKHEYYHLILDHITSRKPPNKEDYKLWNIAADLAINSHLKNELPDMCCIPGRSKFASLPLDKEAEWYFAELKKQQQEQKNKGNSGNGEGQEGKDPSDGQFDDHDGWDKIEQNASGKSKNDNINKDIIREKVRNILQKAVNEVVSHGNSWGSVSSEMKSTIMKRLESVVDWRKVLRWFVRNSQRADKNNSIRKINKRFPYIHSGKRVNRQANIAISIDQSGSVSDELLSMFYSELDGLAQYATFTVIPFDSEVIEKQIFVWKKRERKPWQRVACGGTDFDAPTSYVNNDPKFDGHIILTDLCAPKPISSKVQRLWMTSEENAKQPYFQTDERIVAITKKV